MSHIWMSHVTSMNESCHKCECVMSHVSGACTRKSDTMPRSYNQGQWRHEQHRRRAQSARRCVVLCVFRMCVVWCLFYMRLVWITSRTTQAPRTISVQVCCAAWVSYVCHVMCVLYACCVNGVTNNIGATHYQRAGVLCCVRYICASCDVCFICVLCEWRHEQHRRHAQPARGSVVLRVFQMCVVWIFTSYICVLYAMRVQQRRHPQTARWCAGCQKILYILRVCCHMCILTPV